MFQVSNQIKKPSTCWCDFLLLVSGLLLMSVLLAFYSVYLLRVDVTTSKQANRTNVTDATTGFESRKISTPLSILDAHDGVRNETGNGDRRYLRNT
ncbi:hypothetical protein GHT06_005048 [Daphnia sinensis]|uniref:Uncharacterized protein n=1 Tax=Daphnia sinensis TaxID=1820382 RepID=A0AAD5PKG5_9CRUS|nr:hypothetical protein GHT06_005048 [Daphnia sinensis]